MKISAKTDTGIVRAANQDTFEYNILSDTVCFAVVCDGMGGAAGGSVASAIAVNTIAERLNRVYLDGYDLDSFADSLVDSIVSANTAVYEKSLEDVELAGMGTTVVTVFIDNDVAYIAHVGDSRIYLAEAQGIHQLTRDHSYVQALLDSGYISEDEAMTHPKRNMITRALGVDKTVNVDFARVSLMEGDILLLCSDGLTNYVSKDLIYKNLLDEDFDSCAVRLVALANDNGGGDNITALAVKI